MMRERIWRSSPRARIDTSSGSRTPATSMRRSARSENGPTLSSKAAWKLEPSMPDPPDETSVTECMIGNHEATACTSSSRGHTTSRAASTTNSRSTASLTPSPR